MTDTDPALRAADALADAVLSFKNGHVVEMLAHDYQRLAAAEAAPLDVDDVLRELDAVIRTVDDNIHDSLGGVIKRQLRSARTHVAALAGTEGQETKDPREAALHICAVCNHVGEPVDHTLHERYADMAAEDATWD